MVKRIGLFLVAGLLAFAGCKETKKKVDSSGDYKLDPSGFQILYFEHGKGKKPVLGDLMELSWVMTYNDSVVRNSADNDYPTIVQLVNPVFKGDISSAFATLQEGDSVSILISVDSVLNSELGRKMIDTAAYKKGNFFKHTIKVKRVYNEDEDLNTYMKKLGKPFTFESGAYIVYLENGKGDQLKMSQKVVFEQIGRKLNGEVFVSSNADTARNAGIFSTTVQYGPSETLVGGPQNLPGWNAIFPKLKVGDHVLVYFPSYLLFGSAHEPYYDLPPFSTLQYEFKILGTK